jgi:hypothetical protein
MTPSSSINSVTRQRQLRVAYAQTFNSEAGQMVLKDLHASFGFGRDPYTPGQSDAEIARRCIMQAPLHHIKAKLEAPLDPEQLPTKATS